MKFASIMMTVPERMADCQASLQSAREAGFDPTVVVDIDHAGPWPTFLRCLGLLAANEAPCLAILQDDVRFATGLADYLSRQMSWGCLGVWSMFTSDRNVAAKSNEECGFFQAKVPTRADGAQGYAFTHRTAHLLLSHPPQPKRRALVDHWVGVFCRDWDVPYLVHKPSLCQHVLPDASTLGETGDPACRSASVWCKSVDPFCPTDARA